MDAHEDRVLGADLPLDEGDVGVAVQLVAVGVRGELAADPQRHACFADALHQPRRRFVRSIPSPGFTPVSIFIDEGVGRDNFQQGIKSEFSCPCSRYP
jgi:hypothetical protein